MHCLNSYVPVTLFEQEDIDGVKSCGTDFDALEKEGCHFFELNDNMHPLAISRTFLTNFKKSSKKKELLERVVSEMEKALKTKGNKNKGK